MTDERPSLVTACLVTATIVKLALASAAGGTADVRQYLQQAQAFLSGADVFDPRNTGHNASFFLIGHYALASVMALVADATGVPFTFWIKVPAILSDLGVSLLLQRTAGRLAAVAYIANPITLLLSVHHGQLHSVATAGAFWAVERASARRPVASGCVLGLAASVRQHFAILVVPLLMFLSGRRRSLVTTFLGVMVVVNLPLLASAYPWRSAGPVSTPGIWGYSIPLLHGPSVLALAGFRFPAPPGAMNDALARYASLFVIAWTIGFLGWTWRRHGTDVWRAAFLFLVGIYAVTPAFGVQWLVWALPFWLVVDARGALVYSILGGLFLMGTYSVWTFPARYGVRSITANLGLLSPVDLGVYLLVGALGIVTWVHCAMTAWRLVHERPPVSG